MNLRYKSAWIHYRVGGHETKCRFPALESLVLHFRNGGFHHTGIDGFHDRTGGVKPSGILIIALSGGHLPHAVFAVIGGMICDLIIGNYESKGRMIIGYGTFALADFLGTVIPVILFGTASFVERASKWKMSEAQINEALSYFKVSWAVGFALITFVLACIGAFVATRILKKHFEKAGVI